MTVKLAGTRRGLLGLLLRIGVVPTVVVAEGIRPALAQTGNGPGELRNVALCPTLDQLRSVDPQAGAVLVEGYNAAADGGGGIFVWVGSAPTRYDGAVRVANDRSQQGHWRRQEYDSGRVRPQWFGAMGGQRDHSALIQAAIDFVESEGGGTVDLGNQQYHCLARLVIDPTRTSLIGDSAVLDFSKRPAGPDTAPIITLGSSSDWATRHAGAGQWQISDNRLSYHWASGAGTTIGRSVPFRGKGRYRLAVTIGELRDDRFDPAVVIALKRANDAAAIGRRIGSVGDYRTEFDWPVDGPGEIEVKATSDVRIDRLEIIAIGDPECLLVQVKATSAQYAQASQSLSGFRMIGPGGRAEADGLLFHTTVPPKSSRLTVRNIEISGFSVGCKFRDRAYLIQFHDVAINARTAIEFVPGGDDTGENISFFGCTFANGEVAIRNGGADLYAYGCSLDYVRQFYVGSGVFHSFGCHYETSRPTEAAQYPFDIQAGNVFMSGGVFLISGSGFELGNKCDYIFHLPGRYSRVMLDNVECWNLRSASGFLAGGNGRIYAERILGNGNKHVAHLTKRDDTHNILGPAARLRDDQILLDVSLSGGELIDRYTSKQGRLAIEKSLARSQGRPLAIIKELGPPAHLTAILLAPFRPGKQVGWEAYMLLRHGAGAKGAIFITSWFVQVTDRDRLGTPVIACREFVGEMKPEVGGSGTSQDWVRIGMGSEYSDNTSPGDGYAPEWTTHVAISFELAHVSEPLELLLDDIFVCQF